jgi:hypothetical protein
MARKSAKSVPKIPVLMIWLLLCKLVKEKILLKFVGKVKAMASE